MLKKYFILETIKLAIVIPYYKIDFFEKCLQSLSKQTCKDFTVYIGNDNSPNNPEEIINKYADQIAINYKKFESNLGGKHLTKQWDRCIEISLGEPWLMILGDDDELGANCVEKFYENLHKIEESNIQVIKFATLEINEKDEEISEKYIHPQFEKSTTAYYKKLIGKGRSSLSEYIFSRNAYNKYGFKEFPLAFGSDNLAWIEFSDCGLIYTINQAVVYFRISTVNISGKTHFAKREKLHAMYLTKKYLLQNYAHAFTQDERKEIIRQSLLNLNSSQRRNYPERVLFFMRCFQWLPPQELLPLYIKNKNLPQ